MVLNSERPDGRFNGPPPEDHPGRCQAKRKCGLRCKRWAIRGARTCQYHGGRRGTYTVNRVPRFYQRKMTAALKAVIAEHLDEDPDEQLSLFTELALMRDFAGQSVAMYSAALEVNKPDMINEAGQLMAMSLQRVADICKSAAAVHSTQKDKFSSHDLNYVIEQIIRISWDCFRDHPNLEQFAVKLREHVQLSQAQGTTITADQQVLEMDRMTADDATL